MVFDNSVILGAVAIGAAVAGGALFTVKYNKQKTKTDTNRVTIKDVNTSGDVAGRDINKRK